MVTSLFIFFNMRIHHWNHTGLYLTPFRRGAIWVWWETSWGDAVAFSGREGINWLRYLGSSELSYKVKAQQRTRAGGSCSMSLCTPVGSRWSEPSFSPSDTRWLWEPGFVSQEVIWWVLGAFRIKCSIMLCANRLYSSQLAGLQLHLKQKMIAYRWIIV